MAKLGDEIDTEATSLDSESDYIVLKSGRRLKRGDMSDAEWAALVADAERQGKVKLVADSLDTSDLKAETRTVEQVLAEEDEKAAKSESKSRVRKALAGSLEDDDARRSEKPKRAESKATVALDTSDLKAETRTVEQAGDEEAAKTESKSRVRKALAASVKDDDSRRSEKPKRAESNESPSKSAGTGMNPASIFAEMVKGAVPTEAAKSESKSRVRKALAASLEDDDAGRSEQEIDVSVGDIEFLPEEASAAESSGQPTSPERRRALIAEYNQGRPTLERLATEADQSEMEMQATPGGQDISRAVDFGSAVFSSPGYAAKAGWDLKEGANRVLSKAAQQVLTPNQLAEEEAAIAAQEAAVAAQEAAAPTAPAAPGGPAPAPVAPGGPMSTAQAAMNAGTPPPGMGGGSSSASMSMRGGSGELDTSMREAQQELLNAEGKRVRAEASENAKLLKDSAAEYASAKTEVLKANADAALQEKAILKIQRDEMQKFESTYQSALQSARDASMESIDPGRFWNNKSAGQKAAAVIAGALFGFTGKGMEWLNRLDNLVSEDVRQQEADRASRVSGLKEYASGQLTAREMAKERGLTDLQANNIDKLQKLEALKIQAESYDLTGKSVEAQTRQSMLISGIEQLKAKALGEGQDDANFEANLKQQRMIAYAQMRQQRELARKGENGGGKMSPGMQQRFVEYGAAARAIRDMMGEYKKFGTSSVPGKPGATSVLPQNVSDSALWEKTKKREWAQIIGVPVEGGKLTDNDFDRYLGFLPSATDTDDVAKERAESLMKNVVNKYTSEWQVARATNTEGWQSMPTPQEFEAQFRAETGLGGSGVAGERAR
jgi:hypothetical protein